MQTQIIIFAVFVCALAYPLSPNADLIEPTRILGGTANPPGSLIVVSEPPALDITLDDSHIGKTPAFVKNVKSGIHRLRVKDSETEIYIEPGETLQISLHKGEFIYIPVAEKEPVEQQATREKKVTEARTTSRSQKKESKYDLTSWERFLNGGFKHFPVIRIFGQDLR